MRPGSDAKRRADVMHEWHKSLLHNIVPSLIEKWEPKLKVKVNGYFLQRMKTKWGSCNHKAGHIRLMRLRKFTPKCCSILEVLLKWASEPELLGEIEAHRRRERSGSLLPKS
jgi:hypothetical protein